MAVSASAQDPWAFYGPRTSSLTGFHRMAVDRFRQSAEQMIPKGFVQPGGLDRELLIAMVTRGAIDLTVQQLQELDKRVKRLGPNATEGRKLVTVLQALGPGYEKLGQLLGNRPDLISEPHRGELAKLSDQASEMSVSRVDSVVTDAVAQVLGMTATNRHERRQMLTQLVERIERRPLGTGSIAQAHLVRMKDGRELVVKVIKENVARMLTNNFNAIGEVLATAGNPAFGRLVAEMKHQSLTEADLRNEARAMNEVRGFLGRRGIAVPRILEDMSGETLLVMELASGEKMRDAELSPAQAKFAAAKVFGTVVELVLSGGTFHGDLHRGNLFIRVVEGRPELTFIDWGLTGRLSSRHRVALGALLGAVGSGDERLIRSALGQVVGRAAPGVLNEVLRAALKEGTALERTQRILLEVQTRDVDLPGPIIAATKALLLAEGVALELDPTFTPVNDLRVRLLPRLWPLRSTGAGNSPSTRDILRAVNEQKARDSLAKKWKALRGDRRALRYRRASLPERRKSPDRWDRARVRLSRLDEHAKQVESVIADLRALLEEPGLGRRDRRIVERALSRAERERLVNNALRTEVKVLDFVSRYANGVGSTSFGSGDDAIVAAPRAARVAADRTRITDLRTFRDELREELARELLAARQRLQNDMSNARAAVTNTIEDSISEMKTSRVDHFRGIARFARPSREVAMALSHVTRLAEAALHLESIASASNHAASRKTSARAAHETAIARELAYLGRMRNDPQANQRVNELRTATPTRTRLRGAVLNRLSTGQRELDRLRSAHESHDRRVREQLRRFKPAPIRRPAR